uniref:ATP synthase F0 subunit 8 n=1 Tax=Blaberus sp. B007 TaxID=2093456 RepID=A0A2P1H6Y8_9NEOP|nr:ATP synthase F0 subunit 8 [Blaberus sp. B007]
MPQMMPLSWLTLYMYFIIMLLLFSFINYFSIIHYPSILKKSISIKSMYWKW